MTRLLALALLLAPLLTGCGDVVSYTPNATGQTGVVLVVTDSLTWAGPAGEAIRDEVGRTTRTLPQPTPAFTLRRQELSDYYLDTIRRQHAVLIAAPFTDETTVAQFLRARLDSAGVQALERGGRGIFFRPDLWARNQVVVYATAATDSALAGQIRANGEALRDAFNRLARERTTRDLFEQARQTDVEDSLMARHGFAVGVQHDYVTVIDTTFLTETGTPGTFVRLARLAGNASRRDLFVYYEEDPRLERLHPDSVVALRNRLTRRFIAGSSDTVAVRVEDRFPERRPIEADTVELGGRFAIETRGTWYLADERGGTSGGGGPFVSYAFFDDETGRFYLVDGQIFAPPYRLDEKREFLRQVEAIAYTFRTSGGGGVDVLGEREKEAGE